MHIYKRFRGLGGVRPLPWTLDSTSINPTHVVTKKGIPLWVIIHWSIWGISLNSEYALIIPTHSRREHPKNDLCKKWIFGNPVVIYVKNGYLATLFYGFSNPEHLTVFKIFPFNSSSSKMLVETQNSCSQIN